MDDEKYIGCDNCKSIFEVGSETNVVDLKLSICPVCR